jgi:hypothetical protein
MSDHTPTPDPLDPRTPATAAPPRWAPIDTSAYIERLEQVKALLEQATALAAATEAARMAPLVELQHRLAEDGRGHPHRRPHR